MVSYWSFDEEPSVRDTALWRLEFEALQSDVIRAMRQREEEATLHVVLDYLRDRGYVIIEPKEEARNE